MRRLIGIYLIVCILLPVFGSAAAEKLPKGYRQAAENEALILYADEKSGGIILESRADGYRWYSNPVKADRKAKGIHKQTLLSQVLVGYSNERGTALSLSSSVDSVKGGHMKMSPIDQGVCASYDFPKAGIRLQLRYQLKEDYLLVQLPVEEIVCYPDAEGKTNLNSVNSVDILPAFGAGSAEEEGYLLVPDGSGALIRFNNGKTSMPEYNALMYGKDYGVEGQIAQSGPAQAQTREEIARMPVFGTCHEGTDPHGLFAVVTGNDAKARILARVSNLTSYNFAYSRFMLKTAGSMVMSSKEFGSSVISIGERDGLTEGVFELRYYPLAGEKAGYVGMAAKYREYLKTEQGLLSRVKEGEYPLYIDAFGYMKKRSQLFGIPYTKTIPLTEVRDLGLMLDAVGASQTIVRYQQWMPGSAFEHLPDRAEILPALGSLEEMKLLDERLRREGGALYPAADFMRVYRQGKGFWAIRDAVLSPVNTPQLQYQFNYGLKTIDMAVRPWYLLSPAKYDHFYRRYFESFSRTGLSGLALLSAADICTSDNRSGGTGRGKIPHLMREVLAASKQDLLLDGGNMYAAVLARHLVGVPGGSSRYDIEDESVPFYQLVLHGSVPYSIGMMNQAARPRQLMLKLLEYGASPHFAFIGKNLHELADSRMVWLLSPDYRTWAEEAGTVYEELARVLLPLSHLEMTDHRNLPNGSVTVYGGKTAVYVNYSAQEQVLEGHLVPAEGYLVGEVK